jgi:membrane protease YdiL (CAAX protease family)
MPPPSQPTNEPTDPPPSFETPAPATLLQAAPVRLEPVQPRLWPVVTVVCSVLLVLAIGLSGLLAWATPREDLLEAPEEFLEHVFSRNLDLEEYADQRSTTEKLLDWLQGYESGQVLDEAIDAYSDFIGNAKSDWTRLDRTLVIMLAEEDRLEEAEETLSVLEDYEDEAQFAAAVRFAYEDGAAESDQREVAIEQITAVVHPAWARDKLIMRMAEKMGATDVACNARVRLLDRGKKLHDQTLPLLWGPVITIGFGVLAVVLWLVTGLPSVQLSTGVLSSPWTATRGVAVMVRAALAGMIVSEVLGTFVSEWHELAFLRGFASLFAILPLLWIGTRKLLRPWGQTLSSCFGLRISVSRWLPGLLFTAFVAAIDLLGSFGISALLQHFGIQMHWAESPQEDYLWMPWWQVVLDFTDGVVWAPICEEIGCRGFLYTTIRRRVRPIPAALLTGVIFGAVHFYSLSGFLSVAWSGLLWSLAYEKSRSLVPGMISHSIGNVLAFGGMVLLYRL